jgi:hypothetical protein
MEKVSKSKRWPIIIFAIIFFVFVGLRVQQYFFPRQATVTIGETTLQVLVANTDASRVKGLSDRKDFGNYGGMIFIFPQADYYTFVMRDMLFPLDIVWINGKTIVDIKERLPPEAGREESELTRYSSVSTADKAIELPAGFVEQRGVKIGDIVQLSL